MPERSDFYGDETSIGADSQAATESDSLVRDVDRRLENLGPAAKTEVVHVLREVIAEHREFFAGPQPPPDLLEHYERIVPGSAKQILEMGIREQQARHLHLEVVDRQNDEILSLQGREISYATTGLWQGFFVVIAIVAVGFFATYLHLVQVAIACFSVAALGAGAAFIKGRNQTPRVAESPESDSRG